MEKKKKVNIKLIQFKAELAQSKLQAQKPVETDASMTSLSGLKKTDKSDVINELNKRRESKKLNLVGGI